MNTFTHFNLEDLYNKYENLYEQNLSSACMPVLALKDILDTDTVMKLLMETKLDYSSETGSLDVQEALVKNLYPKLNTPNFFTTAGASEAIYLVMRSLFNKGDKLIVQKPIYQSLFQIAEDAGAQIIEWQVNQKTNNWDIDELKTLIQENPQAKALIINNPNNPCGTAFNKNELETIIDILEERILISDEVFQPLSLNNSPSVSSLYKNAISICDLSKSFSLPGLRFGWIACQRKDLLKKISALRNYLSLRTNTLAELLAPAILEKSEDIINNNKQILRNNIEQLFTINKDDLFFELDIKKEQISGLCIFPKLKEAFLNLSTEELIKTESTFLALGECFGDDYQGFCRIGLGNLAKFELIQ
jgi:aspartate/methionine/tyrosine aminotransferase